MPSLPLPLGGAYLNGGDLPVVSQADVNAVLPAFLHPEDPATVRDAIFASVTQIMLRYQQRASFAIGMADVLRATGVYLTEAAAERGVFRQVGELDEPLRLRVLTVPALVTPVAIMAAVNSLLAPFTAIKPRYYESNADRYYVRTTQSPTSPRAYIYNLTSIPTSPDYWDRGYPSEVAVNGGLNVPQREPGAMRVFSDELGRYFIIRVPDLTSLNGQGAFVGKGTSQDCAWYVGKGTAQDCAGYVRVNAATAVTIYNSIINVVNRIKGASIRWAFFADPKLTS